MEENIPTAYDDEVDNCQNGDAYPSGESVNAGGYNAMEILAKVKADQLLANEKLLNLQNIVLEVARRHPAVESLVMQNDWKSDDDVSGIFEFDALYGFLDSEVKELDNFISCLQLDVMNVGSKESEDGSHVNVEDKLHNVTISLKDMQSIIAQLRTESVKFGNAIDLIREKTWIGEDTQQGTDMQILKKSDSNESELNNELNETRAAREALDVKLRLADKETNFLQEVIDDAMEQMFAHETVSELYQEFSKGLLIEFHRIQLSLCALSHRDIEISAQLNESCIKLSDAESTLLKLQEDGKSFAYDRMGDAVSTSEVLSFQQKLFEAESHFIGSLENLMVVVESTLQNLQRNDKSGDVKDVEERSIVHDMLRGSDMQAKMTDNKIPKHILSSSMVGNLKDIINNYKESVSKSESMIAKSEAENTCLVKANRNLKEDLEHARENSGELERKLKECEVQLDHAKAAVEASWDSQSMLNSTICDMESMIGGLKEKALNAETRAEKVEAKVNLLEEINLDLEKQNRSLKIRVQSLESSLNEAKSAKIQTAKSIDTKTKNICDLVAKISSERERLHLQNVTLRTKNKILSQRCKAFESAINEKNDTHREDGISSSKTTMEESSMVPSTHIQMKDAEAADIEEVETGSPTPSTPVREHDSELSFENVRTLQPSLLNWKYIVSAVLVALFIAFIHVGQHSGDGLD